MKLNRRGFTLLELMVSISILATLSVLTSQTIQQAIKSKLKIQSQVDDMSQVRDALKIIERDINLAFHYRDIELEMRELVKKGVPAAKPTLDPATGAPISPEATQIFETDVNRLNPETQFIGKENQLSFATMNSARLYSDTQQADFIKVGYAIEDCRVPGEKEETVGCLLRKTARIVEGDPEKFEDKSVLLSHVTELKFRYQGANNSEWRNDWKSTDSDTAKKGNFPEAVEVTLTRSRGEGKLKRKVSMQIVAIIRFPNNKIKTSQIPGGK